MSLLFSVIFFFLAVLAHFMIRINRLIQNSLYAFIFSGLVLGLGLIITLNYIFSNLAVMPSILLYAFLCELYIFLFTFASSSVSANLLVRLRGRSLERALIDRIYDSDQMITRRIDALAKNRLLERKDNIVIITSIGSRVVKLFNLLRHFFGHD